MLGPAAFKQGTRLAGLRPETVVGLLVAQSVFARHSCPLMVTSVTDGTHMRASKHYAGLAFDLRLPSHPTIGMSQDSDMQMCVELGTCLGDEWDVVLEKDHLHVEWDPPIEVKPVA